MGAVVMLNNVEQFVRPLSAAPSSARNSANSAFQSKVPASLLPCLRERPIAGLCPRFPEKPPRLTTVYPFGIAQLKTCDCNRLEPVSCPPWLPPSQSLFGLEFYPKILIVLV